MDFVRVALLTCILIFTKLGQPEATEVNQSCFRECPPGYYIVGKCDDPAAPNKCKKCGHNQFTAISNNIRQCIRCNSCSKNEMVIKNCSSHSDIKCDCKEGFYYPNLNSGLCVSCSVVVSSTDYSRKCPTCQREKNNCMNDPQCKKKCLPGLLTTTPTTPNSSSAITTVSVAKKTIISTPGPRKMSPDRTSNPAVEPVLHNSNSLKVWLFVVLAVAVFLVLFWFLLLYYRNLFRNQDICSCWSPNKDLETPAQETDLKEQHSHYGSRSTTLAFSISEETPMMPACHKPPAHLCDQMAAIQNEQSERWPAIVLYAIIKEVPLRRWKEFLRLLSVPDQQMERVELEAGLGSIEKQYQMLRLWSQQSSASLSEVYSSLHHMDLLGCAQNLQENLEKMQWGPEPRQGLTA